MNDLYTMGGDIGRQATGVAIGGFLSSAHVDMTLMSTCCMGDRTKGGPTDSKV